MIKAIEYGILADEVTENIDVYAYYATMEDFQNNHDRLSVAVTYDNGCFVEITDFDNNVLYSTYVENGIEADKIINVVDAVLGVTRTMNNVDDF